MLLKNLFSPKKIGNLEIRNRVILPSMCTVFADEGGFVSERIINYHRARARGGCGMNIVEIASVHPTSQVPKVLGLHDDKFLPGLTRLASAIKEEGGTPCIQLWHAGRQLNSVQTGMPIVAPSPIPCPLCQEEPEELSIDEINELIESYGDAAQRAKRAGFEAIELHGAHGYLINQFMSPYSNIRTDSFGGSYENRMRFCLEVLNNIKSKVGNDFPIVFRMSSDERVEGGLTLEDGKKIAKDLESAGVNALHVSIGVYETVFYTIPTIDIPQGFNVDAAKTIKETVSIPVIAVGRINDPVMAETIIDRQQADFVSIGRGQIADPEFCNKSMNGEFDSIIKCIGCIQGCFDVIFGSGLTQPACCMLNPSVGHENEYDFVKSENPKKILIAGGGPSGLEAALLLKQKGHEVILCEQSSQLGGQFFIAGIAPRKGEFGMAAVSLGNRVRKSGVDVRLQTKVTPEVIETINPDIVIVSSGSVPIIPEISGISLPHVSSAHDVLKGNATVGDNVVVVGGGLVGLETAEFLAAQKKNVTVVEMLDEAGKDLGYIRKVLTMQHLATAGIEVLTQAKCLEITPDKVVLEKDGKTMALNDIDSVVIAVGARSSNELESCLADSGREYYVVGDAKKARKALDAIWEASETALKVS